MPALGARVLGVTRSPILGGATGAGTASGAAATPAKTKGAGNAEWLALLARADAP